jgi:hypothetical protein
VLDNWQDTCEHGVKNFGYGMFTYLQQHMTTVQFTRSFTTPPVIAMDVVRTALLARRDMDVAAFPADPLDAPSKGAVLCTYARYHHILPHEPLVPLFHLPLSAKACSILLRFMLGHSYLPLHVGRRLGVSRCERVCGLCSMAVIADEYHMIFDCPALAQLRVDRPALFRKFSTPAAKFVQHFMRHADRFAVAGFVLAALRRYKAAVVELG